MRLLTPANTFPVIEMLLALRTSASVNMAHLTLTEAISQFDVTDSRPILKARLAALNVKGL
jgi:hypothetical protein